MADGSRLLKVVALAPTHTLTLESNHGQIPSALAERKFRLSAPPDATFDVIWSLVEAKLKQNYGESPLQIKKLQDQDDVDIDLDQRLMHIFQPADEYNWKGELRVVRAFDIRDCSVPPGSSLQPQFQFLQQSSKRPINTSSVRSKKRRWISDDNGYVEATEIGQDEEENPLNTTEHDVNMIDGSSGHSETEAVEYEDQEFIIPDSQSPARSRIDSDPPGNLINPFERGTAKVSRKPAEQIANDSVRMPKTPISNVRASQFSAQKKDKTVNKVLSEASKSSVRRNGLTRTIPLERSSLTSSMGSGSDVTSVIVEPQRATSLSGLDESPSPSLVSHAERNISVPAHRSRRQGTSVDAVSPSPNVQSGERIPSSKKTFRLWSEEEENIVISLTNAGYKPWEISEKYFIGEGASRSAKAIARRIEKLRAEGKLVSRSLADSSSVASTAEVASSRRGARSEAEDGTEPPNSSKRRHRIDRGPIIRNDLLRRNSTPRGATGTSLISHGFTKQLVDKKGTSFTAVPSFSISARQRSISSRLSKTDTRPSAADNNDTPQVSEDRSGNTTPRPNHSSTGYAVPFDKKKSRQKHPAVNEHDNSGRGRGRSNNAELAPVTPGGGHEGAEHLTSERASSNPIVNKSNRPPIATTTEERGNEKGKEAGQLGNSDFEGSSSETHSTDEDSESTDDLESKPVLAQDTREENARAQQDNVIQVSEYERIKGVGKVQEDAQDEEDEDEDDEDEDDEDEDDEEEDDEGDDVDDVDDGEEDEGEEEEESQKEQGIEVEQELEEKQQSAETDSEASEPVSSQDEDEIETREMEPNDSGTAINGMCGSQQAKKTPESSDSIPSSPPVPNDLASSVSISPRPISPPASSSQKLARKAPHKSASKPTAIKPRSSAAPLPVSSKPTQLEPVPMSNVRTHPAATSSQQTSTSTQQRFSLAGLIGNMKVHLQGLRQAQEHTIAATSGQLNPDTLTTGHKGKNQKQDSSESSDDSSEDSSSDSSGTSSDS